MTRRLGEFSLQREILGELANMPRCAVLQPRGGLAGAKNPIAVFWRANTGAARNSLGALVRFGVRGQADIHGIALGLFVAIEVKLPRARQTAEQRTWQAAVEAAGGIYILARSLEDALNPVKRMIEP
jgi:hypothetical protein